MVATSVASSWNPGRSSLRVSTRSSSPRIRRHSRSISLLQGNTALSYIGGLPTLLCLRFSLSTRATTPMKARIIRLGRVSGLMPAVPKFWIGFWTVSGASPAILKALLATTRLGSSIAMVKRRRKRIGGRVPGSYALLARVSNEVSGVSIRSRHRPNDRATGGRGRSAAMALRPAQPMAAFSTQRPGAIGLGLACLLGQLRLSFDLESGRLPRTRHARTLPEIHRRGGPLLSARMPHKGRTTAADRYVVSALILDEFLYHSFAVVTLEPAR